MSEELKEIAYITTKKQQITIYKNSKCFIVSNQKRFYIVENKEDALNSVLKLLWMDDRELHNKLKSQKDEFNEIAEIDNDLLKL